MTGAGACACPLILPMLNVARPKKIIEPPAGG
jgi:hypothetical protein